MRNRRTFAYDAVSTSVENVDSGATPAMATGNQSCLTHGLLRLRTGVFRQRQVAGSGRSDRRPLYGASRFATWQFQCGSELPCSEHESDWRWHELGYSSGTGVRVRDYPGTSWPTTRSSGVMPWVSGATQPRFRVVTSWASMPGRRHWFNLSTHCCQELRRAA